MFKNALVSVSDKTGLVEFLKPLVAKGMRVVSTGGTLKHLRENQISAVDVADQTGFQEVMDGRVKTLHPRVHMALLARLGNTEDAAILKKENLDPFDLVVVNLYPFEAARLKEPPLEELIEYIDIGGPSMLRSAAKSHDRIAVVCEPSDYTWIQEKSELTLDDRRRLAARVFAHTAKYDDLIAKTLASTLAKASTDGKEGERPRTLVGQLVGELRYGENPHQKAWWYRSSEASSGLHAARILHGKPLSFNNILDLDAAVETVREFKKPCAVAVKHNNPCGVGTDTSILGATQRALLADPVSVFGGIIAFNAVVDGDSAQALAKIFLECVIAPGFSDEAFAILSKKKDLRILEWPEMNQFNATTKSNYGEQRNLNFRSVNGGYLVQDSDITSDWSKDWRILGQAPNEQVKSDLVLAWKTCAHLKSNAIAIASQGCTVGLGMGQVNRVDAVGHAVARMRKHHSGVMNGQDLCLASDAFFPFPDSLDLAAEAGVRWIIQPGGSIRDDAVFTRAGELGVNMVLTGTRHFRH